MEAVFSRAFSFRPPYQFILDSDFLDTSLKQKLPFRETIPIVLGGAVRMYTTACVVNELKVSKSEATFNARRLEVRRCNHSCPISGGDCIKEIIGNDNVHHYGVCAQDPDLRECLRSVPGVPLVFINRGILLLEDPSQATLKHAEELERRKRKVDEAEMKIISKVAPIIEPLEGKKKKKKHKEPNPLSCKKKQVKVSKAAYETVDRKQQRRHRPKK